MPCPGKPCRTNDRDGVARFRDFAGVVGRDRDDARPCLHAGAHRRRPAGSLRAEVSDSLVPGISRAIEAPVDQHDVRFLRRVFSVFIAVRPGPMSPPRCWRYPSTSPALPTGGRRRRRRATLLPRPAMICTRPASAVLRSESSSRRPIPAAAVRRRGKGATGEARIARRSLAAAEARVAAPNRLEVHVRKRRAAVSPPVWWRCL